MQDNLFLLDFIVIYSVYTLVIIMPYPEPLKYSKFSQIYPH